MFEEILQNHLYKVDKIIGLYGIRECKQSHEEHLIIIEEYFQKVVFLKQFLSIDHRGLCSNKHQLTYVLNFVEKKIVDEILEVLSHDLSYLKEHFELEYLIYQLKMVKDYIIMFLTQPHDDLFNQPQDSEEWEKVNKHVKYVKVDHTENIDFYFSILQTLVRLGIGICKIADDSSQKKFPYSIFSGTFNIGKNLIHRKMDHITSKAFINPDPKFVVNLMTNQDKLPGIKTFLSRIMVPIETEYEWFIPRIFSEPTLEQINSEILKGTQSQITGEGIYYNNFDFHLLNIFKKHKDSIPLRVLSAAKRILRDKLQPEIILQNLLSETEEKQHNFPNSKIKNIVLHFHGGAWISTSSFFHQNYMRKWSNFLGEDTIVLSVDYRLAPDHKYPSAHNDCWQAYLWAVYLAKYYLNTNVEKLILTGDSAGGNMALAVTYRAIKLGLRKPDGVFLVYPATSGSIFHIKPSNLLGVVDKMQPLSLMLEAVKLYTDTPNVHLDKDPYLNPELIGDDILKEWPNTTICVGEKDCLKDNSIYIAHKILKVKGESEYPKVYIYNDLCHGFLCLDWPGMPLPFLPQVTADTCHMIQDLLNA